MQKWLQTTLILFAVAAAGQAFAQEPEFAYYTFNQTSGQTVPNYAVPGLGNNPAFLSAPPIWQTTGGPAGGALNEYVDLSAAQNGIDTGITMPAGNQDFTIEFWFKRNNASGIEVFVTNNNNFHIYMDGAGRIRWIIGPGETLNSPGTGYDDNNWHHIACTYDRRGGNDRARLYVDGTRYDNNNVTDPTWGSSTVHLFRFAGLYQFGGQFDEFRWWDNNLGTGQIRNNDDVEQLPAQPFLLGPNLVNILDASTYAHPDVIENATHSLPFEFHNGDATDYTGVSVSVIGQSGATAVVSTALSSPVTSGSSGAFDIDITVTNVPYSIDLQIDYTHLAVPQTYTWTISGNTKVGLPDWLYYRFNEGSGSTAANDSGAPTPATFSVAPTWNTIDPAIGTASVDANGGELDTGFNVNVLNGLDFTMEFWMRTNTTTGNQGMVSSNNEFGFGLFNGELTVRRPGTWIYVNQSTTVNDGLWHHLAYVYDDTAGTLTIHLDGNTIFSYTFPLTLTNGNNLMLWRNYDAAQPFVGEIDEFRLWDGVVIPPTIGGGSGGEIIPDIVMHRPFGSVLANGSTDTVVGAFETIASNLTYTVENAGDITLNVSSATITPVTNCSVGALAYTASIGESGTDAFVVSITPTITGYFEATLIVNSNDPDTPAYTITVSGT
ncbi:MAG: LamG domain-containing protein, partial [Planctomycetota bacterium]